MEVGIDESNAMLKIEVGFITVITAYHLNN